MINQVPNSEIIFFLFGEYTFILGKHLSIGMVYEINSTIFYKICKTINLKDNVQLERKLS